MRGVMNDPSQRKKRERYSGPPCPHYPHKFKTEAAHQGKLQARLRAHHRFMKSSLDYRLKAILRTVVQRCDDPRHASYRWYGGKGIKNFLTFEDVKYLWFRDNAAAMKRPSLDRCDSSDDYNFDNCRFMELYDNQTRWDRHKKNMPKKESAVA